MINLGIAEGRFTTDPDLSYTAGGIAKCTFSLACDRGYSKKKKEEEASKGNPTADFIQIVAWRQQAEYIAKYYHKGDLVSVCGRMNPHSWKTSDGVTHYGFNLVIGNNGFHGLSTKSNNTSTNTTDSTSTSNTEDTSKPQVTEENDSNEEYAPVPEDNDLPF